MAKRDKPPVTASVGIQIKAPKGFSIDGDNKVSYTKEKYEPETEFLTYLYNHLEYLEEQKQKIRVIINKIRGGSGCSGCGK